MAETLTLEAWNARFQAAAEELGIPPRKRQPSKFQPEKDDLEKLAESRYQANREKPLGLILASDGAPIGTQFL